MCLYVSLCACKHTSLVKKIGNTWAISKITEFCIISCFSVCCWVSGKASRLQENLYDIIKAFILIFQNFFLLFLSFFSLWLDSLTRLLITYWWESALILPCASVSQQKMHCPLKLNNMSKVQHKTIYKGVAVWKN